MDVDLFINLRDAFTIGWTMVVSGLVLCWLEDRRGESGGDLLFIFGVIVLFPLYFMWFGSYLQFGM